MTQKHNRVNIPWMLQHKNSEMDPWTGQAWDPAVFAEIFPEAANAEFAQPVEVHATAAKRESHRQSDRVEVSSQPFFGYVSVADSIAAQRRR